MLPNVDCRSQVTGGRLLVPIQSLIWTREMRPEPSAGFGGLVVPVSQNATSGRQILTESFRPDAGLVR